MRSFSAEYRGSIFIAEHGSWNRSERIGYRVGRVVVEGGRAVKQEIFAEGWLDGGRVWGRPVDVEAMPDGSRAPAHCATARLSNPSREPSSWLALSF